MNNLIYTICDTKYEKLLDIWVSQINLYNTIDILIITPKEFRTNNNIPIHKIEHFDYQYTSKFVINSWNNVLNYDNFLFLDLDIVCQKSLDQLFLVISEHPDIIHGVVEYPDLVACKKFWRFDDITEFDIHNCKAYNAGTFGFNQKMLPIFTDFLQFVNTHKSHAYCDQPIFNMFFNHHKFISPTLSDYVYLDEYNNSKPKNEYPLVHFLGHYGNIDNKLERIQKYVKN